MEPELAQKRIRSPNNEHSVPLFWPIAAAIEFEEKGLELFEENMRFIGGAARIEAPPEPDWATGNHVILELDTMRLRDFSTAADGPVQTPVLIDAPYAGHSSTIADYAKGQSLVETFKTNGLSRVFVTDWMSATAEMRDYDIDKYLTDIDTAVKALGGRAHFVGLRQGGWMSAMYVCLFPDKLASLVLAGAPIDTDAGDGPIKRMAHEMPMAAYEEMVALGDGRMLCRYMLAEWKDMHPGEQYLEKFIDLYEYIEGLNYITRTEQFERWYENPINLPGLYYLKAIRMLFKENLFPKGEFVALGRKLSLRSVTRPGTVTCPVYLLAGEADDITTKAQVFAAEHLVGTPVSDVHKMLVSGGHIGLFMGRKTLETAWPDVAAWIAAVDQATGDSA